MTRKQILRLVYIIVSLNSSYALFAQTDSITVTEIIADSIDFNYKKAYRYLDYKLNNDKSIFKIGFETTLLETGHYTKGGGFSYEQKVSPNFSIIGKVRNYNSIEVHEPNDTSETLGFGLQARYYLNKKKHLKYKTGGNNCIGAYLFVGAHDIVAFKKYPNKPSLKREGEKDTKIEPIYHIGGGYQFLITKNIFVDLNAYAFYYQTKYDGGSSSTMTGRLEGSVNYTFRLKKIHK